MEDHPEQSERTRDLARLYALDDSSEGEWQEQELGAVFRHQWGLPLRWESPVANLAVSEDRGAQELAPPQTLQELLSAHQPPLDALVRVKEWAKSHLSGEESALPRQVALAVYYGAIFAGLVRLSVRVSALGDVAIVDAAQWLMQQDWVDPELRGLALEVRARLGRPGGRSHGSGDTPSQLGNR